MKRYTGLTFIAVLAAIVSFGVVSEAKSSRNVAGGLLFELALKEPKKTTLVIGQPVIFEYRFKNQATHRMGIDLERFQGSWYTVAIEYPDGDTIHGKDILPVKPQGYRHKPDPRLLPDETKQGYVAFGQWAGELKPGNAVLRFSVAVPFADTLSDEEYPDLLLNLRQAGPLWKKEAQIPVEIVPAEPTVLRRKAQELLQTWYKTQGAEREAILEALFLLPEKYALSSWNAVITDRTAWPSVVPCLAKLESRRAADLLESMAWLPDGSKWSSAQDVLARMYNRTKDSDLKTYIRKLYARHGMKVGDQITIPDVII